MRAYNELVVKSVYKRENFCTQGFCHWKMNLAAVSTRDRETLFVAVDDVIFVYSLSQFEEFEENKSTREPKEPIRKLRRNWNDSENQTINAIKVGMLGQEEMLVCVDDSGGICLWYTADLNRRPIFLSNDESTWGIALQGQKRLLAVSANSYNITIYNLKAHVNQSECVNNHKGSLRSSKSTILRRFSDVVEMGDVPQYSLVGHSHNIPSISFSPCGNFLVSCSIDCSCRIWNVQTGEIIVSRDVSRLWGWSACFVSTSSIKSAPESVSAWVRPLYMSNKTDPNRSNQPLERTRQGSEDNNDGNASNVGNVDATTVSARDVLNVRFDHLETEFEDGYLDTTGDDNAIYSSDHESDQDGDQESDSENGIESIIDLDDENGNDSNIPMPEIISDEGWGSASELHHIVNNDGNGNERNEVASSPISRPNAPDVHRHVEHSSFNPSFPLLTWSSNSPPYSPASPYNSVVQSSTNTTLSQPLPTLHSTYSNYSRENSQNSQPYSTNQFSREHSHISQSRSSSQYTPTLLQLSPLLHPSSRLPPSQSPADFNIFRNSPNSGPTNTNNNDSHVPSNDEAQNRNDAFSTNVMTSDSNHNGSFSSATPLHSVNSPIHMEAPENSIIDDRSESGYTTISQYNDAPTSPNHESSASRERSSSHSQSSPNHVVNSPAYSPLSLAEIQSPRAPQLSERRQRVYIPPTITRRISNFRISEVLRDEVVRRTIDHSPRIPPNPGFNTNFRESKCRRQGKPHAEELILFSTQHDLYLLDPKSGLRTLDYKRGIIRDPRRGSVLTGHDRLNMVEYIPELSLAVVASQKGKVALVRILKKCNLAGQENYSLSLERDYLPSDPLPNAPLLGMFVVKNFTKGLAPQSCSCRLYLAYTSGELYCYNIQRPEQSGDLIGLDQIIL
ncbi:7621_t:CDS:2 [Acaulospora morrowiae]|uniref:7621_t:CDS:1 n=1 Tax=Acaulospora morrowiae TaxID=94023 RepID=A0A9N9GG03_9GLOM|nr:7621_t:CDS:2 [Acaulospora morrowiae]